MCVLMADRAGAGCSHLKMRKKGVESVNRRNALFSLPPIFGSAFILRGGFIRECDAA